MYKILTTQDLKRLGFSNDEIRFARSCCLFRLYRGVYVARHKCQVHSHRPLWASIEEDAHSEFKEFGDMRDRVEELHAAVMARCEVTFQRRQNLAGGIPSQPTGKASATTRVPQADPVGRQNQAAGGQHPSEKKADTVRVGTRATKPEKTEIFSHISAALLHGLPVAYPVTHQVEVFRPGVNRRFKSIHVRGGSVPAHHQLRVRGSRVTTLERTLIDVARSYHLDISVAMLDNALHRKLTTIDKILTAFDQCLETRNAKKVELALRLVDPRRESPAESIAAVRFYFFGIGGFVPQVKFHYEMGSSFIRVDFCHEAAKLIVEIDGIGKLYLGSGVPRKELEKERRREQWLRDQGYRVIRISWKELFRETKFEEIKLAVMQSA